MSDGRGSYLWVDEDELAAEAEPPAAVGDEPHADPRVIAAEFTGHADARVADASAADVPGDVARWAPVGEAEQTLTAREAAQRLGEEGFTEAAGGSRRHGLPRRRPPRHRRRGAVVGAGLPRSARPSARAERAQPGARLDAEEARRHELNRWHAADSAADSAEAGAVDELDDSAVRS